MCVCCGFLWLSISDWYEKIRPLFWFFCEFILNHFIYFVKLEYVLIIFIIHRIKGVFLGILMYSFVLSF